MASVIYAPADLAEVSALAPQCAPQTRRQMPTRAEIARFHGVHPMVCFRCGVGAQTVRAHVIGREFGGADTADNLVPLCPACHRVQPIFVPGEEFRAWAWFYADPYAYAAVLITRLVGDEDSYRDAMSLLDTFADITWRDWWECAESGHTYYTWMATR